MFLCRPKAYLVRFISTISHPQQRKEVQNMQILKTSLTDDILKYGFMNSPENLKLSEIPEGTLLHVSDFVLYEREYNGENRKHISIAVEQPDNTIRVYVTNSQTFITEFEGILSVFGDDCNKLKEHNVKILKGTSKKGRTFITCTLVP